MLKEGFFPDPPRFILRILPAEVTCYASEEEISKAIKPLLLEHFPALAQIPQKVE